MEPGELEEGNAVAAAAVGTGDAERHQQDLHRGHDTGPRGERPVGRPGLPGTGHHFVAALLPK